MKPTISPIGAKPISNAPANKNKPSLTKTPQSLKRLRDKLKRDGAERFNSAVNDGNLAPGGKK